jgi:hypothetical protein
MPTGFWNVIERVVDLIKTKVQRRWRPEARAARRRVAAAPERSSANVSPSCRAAAEREALGALIDGAALAREVVVALEIDAGAALDRGAKLAGARAARRDAGLALLADFALNETVAALVRLEDGGGLGRERAGDGHVDAVAPVALVEHGEHALLTIERHFHGGSERLGSRARRGIDALLEERQLGLVARLRAHQRQFGVGVVVRVVQD